MHENEQNRDQQPTLLQGERHDDLIPKSSKAHPAKEKCRHKSI